jgi:hypothetical protein
MNLGTRTEVEYIKYLNRRIHSIKSCLRAQKKSLDLKFINEGKLEALQEVKAEMIKLIKERKKYYHVDK